MAYIGLLCGVLFLVLPIAGFVLSLRTRRRLNTIDRQEEAREQTIRALERRLGALEHELRATTREPAAGAPIAFAPPPVDGATETVQRAVKPAAPAAKPPSPVPAAPPIPRPTVSPSRTVVSKPGEPTIVPVPPPKPPPTAAPTPPAPPVTPSLPSIDWESLVGVRLFSWIAGIALVFAAVFFLRYSIEHGWLGPPMRMAIGLVAGTGLLIICELRAARRYAVTANALTAAGIAILFSTLFASHALWNLLPQLPVFLLMMLVTAVAVLLSVRHESLFIALLGLLGGFATPALLSTGADRPIGLFSYLLLLNSGLAWVAFRKGWPLLTALSVVFTALYQWAWVLKFLDTSRLPLAMSIFLVFPLLHVCAIAWGERSGERGEHDPLFGQAATLSTALPVVFTIYMAAIPAYGARYALLFSFLFLVVVGLTVLAVTRGPQILHVLGTLATVLGFVIWFARSYESPAWPGVLGFVVIFVLFHLSMPLLARWFGRPLADEAVGDVAAAVLLFAFPVLAAIEPATAAPGVLFAVLFILLLLVAAVAVMKGAGRLHFLSAFFALAAEAVWSAKHLTPERLLAALTMYAAFGLLYLGVPLAAERLGKRLKPEGSGALALFVSIGFLFFLATGPVAHSALWGMGLLLAILNLGLFFEASAGRLPLLSILGVVLSWIVIAVWWATAMATVLLIPSLMIVAGFALLIMGGNVWARKRVEAGGERGRDTVLVFDRGLYLALVGHVFLFFVAGHRGLALPPWPLFGVLALLDIAIGTAALYTGTGELHLAALIASQLILALWVMVAAVPPWPLVGILSAGTVVALALIWMPLSRRVGARGDWFSRAAVAAIFLAQLVTITASGQGVPPALGWLVLSHVALLVSLLAVTWVTEWHVLAVWAVVPTTLATALWLRTYLTHETWTGQLLFAGVLYAVFLAYPVLLGKRARRAHEPYLAALLAGIAFFFLARSSIIVGGFGDFIGILPVGQALLMLGLLLRLLRIEAPGERQTGRLALVASGALAFATVAIPLQLDREWITIGWALEGTALAWLYRRIPHRGLLAWSTGLCVVVFARLCVNPAVFAYHPRGTVPIWNWYLYTYLVAAAALFAAARLLRDTNDRIEEFLRVSDMLPAGGTVLLFLLLNIEIADFYSTGPTLTFNFSAGLAQDLTYTLGWALFAIGLLAAAIAGRSRMARIASLGLLVITVVKCFLHDLWRLGGLYRVGSFVGLATCLAMVALLLQRFVLGAQRETP